MVGKEKSNSNPLGVPLDDLLLMLKPTTIMAHQDGNTVFARHELYTTRIEVIPPEQQESQNRPIRAVIRITTELPDQLKDLFKVPEIMVVMNKFSALGALTWQHGKFFVGSRLTIYEAEDAWAGLHLPLILFTAICGTDAILGAIRRTFSGEKIQGGDSSWTEDDLKQVDRYLSQICFCTTGSTRFTAEIGLAEGAVSAVVGDHHTALLELMTNEPHPELGGGLFCLLQMPHRLDVKERLMKLCVQLNNMEMAAYDLPPHFGAWCVGQLGNNPAYVSFFPNVLHSASGIAVNAAIWAIHRAEWANAVLASLGICE